MNIEIKHPTSGKSFEIDDSIDVAQLCEMNNSCKEDKHYNSWIDRLDGISALMRNILKELVPVTLKIGDVVLRIGKIIINLLMKIISQFPNTVVGILLGFVFGLIVSSIPFFGWLLGPFVTPLFTIAGGVMGFYADMMNKIAAAGIEQRVRASVKEELTKAGFKPS